MGNALLICVSYINVSSRRVNSCQGLFSFICFLNLFYLPMLYCSGESGNCFPEFIFLYGSRLELVKRETYVRS